MSYADWNPEDAFRAGYAIGWRCITELGFEPVASHRNTRGGSYVAGMVAGFRDRRAGHAKRLDAWVQPPIAEWGPADRERFAAECQAAVRPPH